MVDLLEIIQVLSGDRGSFLSWVSEHQQELAQKLAKPGHQATLRAALCLGYAIEAIQSIGFEQKISPGKERWFLELSAGIVGTLEATTKVIQAEIGSRPSRYFRGLLTRYKLEVQKEEWRTRGLLPRITKLLPPGQRQEINLSFEKRVAWIAKGLHSHVRVIFLYGSMARHAVELGAAIWQAQEHYRRGPGSPLPWNDQEAFRFASAFGEHLGQLPKNWIQSSPVLKGIMKVARDPGLRGAGDGLFQVLALLPNRVVKVKNDESIQFVACEGLSPDAYQRTMESLLSIFPKINWPPGITSQESGSQIRAQANLRPLGINLDLRNRKIDRNSFPPLDLSNRTTEWQLFILLAENVGNLVYFEALGRVVGGDTPGHRPNLQSHISHLRFKIKKLGGEILPSRNLGYRLHFK